MRRSGIRPGHVLYPMVALYALVGLLFGPRGRSAADDAPDDKTHPYFPDHSWPYPILATVVLITLGLLALVGQPVLQAGQAANPRAAIIPRPEWYFLALFQLAKLGPALVTKLLVPVVLVLGLVFWPLLDNGIGPRLARRLGWRSWPVPKHNTVTGTIWIAGLVVVGLLTLWSAFAPQLCIPWPYYGPVCGG
jgi:quinol-cytochrome oxidoreductase complex cytochrome b subunit